MFFQVYFHPSFISLPLGQVISAPKEDIIKAYYPGYFMQSVDSQIQTKQVMAVHDDSYQGKRGNIILVLLCCPFTQTISSFVCQAR